MFVAIPWYRGGLCRTCQACYVGILSGWRAVWVLREAAVPGHRDSLDRESSSEKPETYNIGQGEA